ncbi:MAG: valine--tRNA ligase [bacterium]|nr:valine--tRNA ligase [bacterium]
MSIELEKNYNYAEAEKKWYEYWTNEKMFAGSSDSKKPPYSIVIPPPNVTGELHLGHAMDHTLQDVLIRGKKMMGFETVWVPGTDHAGIATQKKVEDKVRKEGETRYTLGREKFIEKIWEWKNLYGNQIIEQCKRLGNSCDWDRLRFTMDEGCCKAVREAFYRLYKKGIIYKGRRLINWCPRCRTALSDLEVNHKDMDSKLYYLRYMVKGEEGFITIATTRPETILADAAICVHPEDDRYKSFIGKEVIIPLTDRAIPVIADEVVERDFGTGALKITPAHDPTDYEAGKRHNLPSYIVIDENGKMNSEAGKYCGMDRFECRTRIAEDLENAGLLEKTEDYKNSVGVCYRCDTVIEPYLSWQWFAHMDDLAKRALDAEKEGKVRFTQERYANTFRTWLENIKDWCISRQLWWGHRIPVWTCGECGHMDAFKEDPECCPKCGSKNFNQEEDVLDTWFSSGLWPLSTLGWPNETKDLDFFYPTKVLITARDIIFLWVARMIMFGLEFKNEVPFSDVHVHATLLGKDGRRMSKSLGTGVDPLLLIDKYGADALRFSLVHLTGQGQDIKFPADFKNGKLERAERVEKFRNYANKVWNAARFCLGYIPEDIKPELPDTSKLSAADRWIISGINRICRDIKNAYDTYSYDVIANSLYDFFWDDFCDRYIETVKSVLSSENGGTSNEAQVLLHVFNKFLRLLHPVMPFITEELWHLFPGCEGSIMNASFPEYEDALSFPEDEKTMESVFETVKAIRSLRADVSIAPKKKVKVYVIPGTDEIGDLIKKEEQTIKNLASAEEIVIASDRSGIPSKSIACMASVSQVFLPALEIENLDKQIEGMEKEAAKAVKAIEAANKKLSNEAFLAHADEGIIAKEKEKLAEAEAKAAKLVEQIKVLRGN